MAAICSQIPARPTTCRCSTDAGRRRDEAAREASGRAFSDPRGIARGTAGFGPRSVRQGQTDDRTLLGVLIEHTSESPAVLLATIDHQLCRRSPASTGGLRGWLRMWPRWSLRLWSSELVSAGHKITATTEQAKSSVTALHRFDPLKGEGVVRKAPIRRKVDSVVAATNGHVDDLEAMNAGDVEVPVQPERHGRCRRNRRCRSRTRPCPPTGKPQEPKAAKVTQPASVTGNQPRPPRQRRSGRLPRGIAARGSYPSSTRNSEALNEENVRPSPLADNAVVPARASRSDRQNPPSMRSKIFWLIDSQNAPG